MIASTASSTGCCASCATVPVLFLASDQPTPANEQLEKSFITYRNEEENCPISDGANARIFSLELSALYDRRHSAGPLHSSYTEGGVGPANAIIHHGSHDFYLFDTSQRRKEKQPPVDPYNSATLISQRRIERQQQHQDISHRPSFLNFSLRRRQAKAPTENYHSLKKKPSAKQRLLAMGQRLGRQQAAPEVTTSADEAPNAASTTSLFGVSGGTGPIERRATMNEYGGGCQWRACAPGNGLVPRPSNDHYYHQYLSQQPYATIMNSKSGRYCDGNKSHIVPTLQEREQQMRTSAIGDRLANFREKYNCGSCRDISPCRQIIDACGIYDLPKRADTRNLAALLATPRLVRPVKVRQQTPSPLASTPLLQKRIHQQSGSNYPPTSYCPSANCAPYNPSSPAPRRNGTLPAQSTFADRRPLENSPIDEAHDLNGLEPPPPTPEEAEDCLAAHLRVICHESLKTRNRKQIENWPGQNELCKAAAKTSGSTDVLLDSRYPSQQSFSLATDVMPSSRRSSSRPSSSAHQAPGHFHPCFQQQPHSSSALGQSQESLMSLMSTSSTSMAVPAGHRHQQHASGSSVGSHSPSVLVRGPCRHSHHYGVRHRAGPSSSCGSSSQGSSDCSFGVIGSRGQMYRRSARNLNIRTPRVAATNRNDAQKSDGVLYDLKPLPFEVPCVESVSDDSTIFVGRDWIFHELHEILVKASSPEYGMKGAVVYGGVGTGKTALVNQLASYSPFLVGDGEGLDFLHDSTPVNGSPSSDRVQQHAIAVISGAQPRNRTSNSTDSGFVSGSKLSLNKHAPAPAIPVRYTHHLAPPRPPLPDWHRSVCQAVVAFHLCQIEHQVTCILPDFLRNLAAMFACSPQLSAYREFLCQQPKLQHLLTLDELLKNPIRSFRLAVTEPLNHLRKCGKIGTGHFLILIDGLDEAEFHRPEFGDSIASFLVKHAMSLFPEWMKLVLTVKTAAVDLLKGIPLHKINLDDTVIDEWVFKDSKEYIRLRISQSFTIQTNISNTKAPSGDAGSSPSLSSSVILNSSDASGCPLARFAAHLASASKGNFLYMKLTLNLIEKNYLVMKGANYKVLPINLSEVFLLMFNLRFPTARAFERVAPILNAILASLKPLTGEELHGAVAAGMTNGMAQEEFQERLNILGDYLVRKQDGTYILFHPAFREWLIRRDDGQNPKYLCDMRFGHALLAFRLSRRDQRLDAGEMQELGHHLLKAHIYKRPSHKASSMEDYDASSAVGRDCQLLWLNQAAADLRSCLCTNRNACYPNSKVSRLLLLAGASADAVLPNFRVDESIEQSGDHSTPTTETATGEQGTSGTPLLCSAAFYGQQEFANLLLEFGADVGATDSYQGRSPLMLAAAEGHLDMVQLLHQHGAKLSQIDNEHRCALVHAAGRGHAHVVSFLLQCDWTELADNQRGNDVGKANMASSTYGYALRQQAAQQAFVAAASAGRTSVCEFLLDFGDVSVDEADLISGETALSAACASARKETVGYLLNRAGARSAYGRQMEKPTPPLLQAVANGCWEIVSTLLARQMEVDGERNEIGQTALMVAAQYGHIAVLELLLSRNVDVSAVDDDGRTALCWACLKDQPAVASLLLERGASLEVSDKHGFGPIHYAAQHGSKQLIQLLLDRCPQLLETPTHSGSRLRPLDLAILADNIEAVRRCLKKGAKLAPSTWTFARDKPSMVAALLNKLLEDGQLLYKRNRLEDAQHRFTYALKKLPQQAASGSSDESSSIAWKEYSTEFERLKFHLQLNYARCLRKNGDAAKSAETCTEAIRNYQQAVLSASGRRLESEQALVDAFVCRARCFCELRQFEKAVEDLRRALRVSPSNKDAQQLLPKVKMALENDSTGQQPGVSKYKDDSNSGSSPPSVSSPPQSSRESSLPVITDDEGRDFTASEDKTPVAAASPSRSEASSDSGNMPDLEDGENAKGQHEIKLRKKCAPSVETQL